MFGSSKAKDARIAELETAMAEVYAAHQIMLDRAYLVSITREGRSNKFMFVRNGEVFEIETMGLMSDNPAQWRADLLEPKDRSNDKDN